MTPSYLSRLVLLSSASFFLVQIVLEAVIAFFAKPAIRRSGSLRPERAARFLLTLRLLPTGFGALVVALLCVPSYLRFEPRIGEEEVGFVCLAAAVVGVWILGAALLRSGSALVRSSQYVQACGGAESSIEGEPVWVVKQSAGLALAGIVKPRLLISEAAIRLLSHDQLAVALQHERAHRASHDNLKRLLIRLAPSIFPQLRLLEQAWTRSAEWAADDQATAGDADRSAALAETLVSIARLQAGIAMPRLITSLVEAEEDLSPRVDRLLDPRAGEESRFRFETIAFSGVAVLIFSIGIGSLDAVHRVLEHLLD